MIEKNEKKNTDFLIFFFIGLFLSLPFYLLPMNNPDLFWHLSAGTKILENFSVPKYDWLSWTKQGSFWVNFEWLTEVIYFLLNNSFAIESLYFLKIGIISSWLFVLSVIMIKKDVEPFHLIWILPLTAAATINSNDVRPENFSVLFFLITLFLLEKNKENRFNFKKISFWLLPLIFTIWANLHGGFIYGLILILIFLAGETLNENIKPITQGGKMDFSCSKNILLVFVLSVLATLINPYAHKLYIVMAEHFIHSSSYQNYIMEWRDLDITNEYLAVFSFLLISAPIVYAINFFKKRLIDMTEVFLMTFFVFAAIFHVRNTIFAALILLIVSAKSIRGLSGVYIKMAMGIFFMSALCLYFILVPLKDYTAFKIEKFYFSSDNMIKFLKENKKELSGLKMYNSWAWGGYLGFKLYPDYKIFIDGRYIFSDMLNEFIDARQDIGRWKEMLKKYDIELVIMPPQSKKKLERKKLRNGEDYTVFSPLHKFQLPSQDWAIVYFDFKNLIAVKRSSVSKEWLKKKEYKLIGPNDTENLHYPLYKKDIDLKGVKSELSRYFKENSPLEENSQALHLLNICSQMESTLKGRKK